MFLGVDIGSQSVKALVVDSRLTPLGQGSVPLVFSAGPDNIVEQDPQLWLDALKPAITAALLDADVAGTSILGLGIGGQLDGCVPVDAAGAALHPCITWMDRRAASEALLVPENTIRQRCGIIRDASHMAAKIAWLKGHRRDIAESTSCFHQPVSFVVQHLTGSRVMDRSLASTTMLYDLERNDWSDDLLAAFGVERQHLPSLVSMEDCAGPLSERGSQLTGLPRGIRVAAGTGDDFTNAIGAGVLSPGVMLCQIGTGEVVGAVHPFRLIDDQRLLETHSFCDGQFFIENPGWLSGGSIAWLLKILRLRDVAELNDLASTVAPGADDVLFLPALTGAMAPEWNADIHACFFNLKTHHGAGHLARAVLEGTAFAMHDVQLRLLDMGIAVNSIRLAGGGASSRLWAQIRADVAQLPVQVCGARDASPLGAAVLAAVTAGQLSSIRAAAPLLNREADWISPDPSLRSTYRSCHRNYLALFQHLKTMASTPAHG